MIPSGAPKYIPIPAANNDPSSAITPESRELIAIAARIRTAECQPSRKTILDSPLSVPKIRVCQSYNAPFMFATTAVRTRPEELNCSNAAKNIQVAAQNGNTSSGICARLKKELSAFNTRVEAAE